MATEAITMNHIMPRTKRRNRALLFASALAAVALAATACTTTEPTDSATSSPQAATETATATPGIDLSLFVDGAIVGEPATVNCTLSGGTEASCYEITISGNPTDHEVGPFCPDTVTTSPDDAGIWFDGDNLYDLDGEFIKNLAQTYGDDGWRMYDEAGNVYVTDTAEAFEAAARPDVDPAYQNYCIEGSFDFLEGGEPIQSKVLIPVTPVAADSAAAP